MNEWSTSKRYRNPCPESHAGQFSQGTDIPPAYWLKASHLRNILISEETVTLEPAPGNNGTVDAETPECLLTANNSDPSLGVVSAAK